MIFQRTATYQIEADSLEQAYEAWDGEGPECGEGVRSVHTTGLERVDDIDLSAMPTSNSQARDNP